MCGLKVVLSSREDGECVAILKGGCWLSFKIVWSSGQSVPALAV